MSRGFNNSIVLTQDSSGVNNNNISWSFFFLFILLIFDLQHCSISAPSLCTIKYVRQYFADGTLPKPGTVCAPDLGPFDSVNLKEGSVEDAQGRLHDMDMNEEDMQLFSAIHELSSSQLTSFYSPFSIERWTLNIGTIYIATTCLSLSSNGEDIKFLKLHTMRRYKKTNKWKDRTCVFAFY